MTPTKTLLLSVAAALVSSGYAFGATLNVDTILGPDHPYQNETITVVDGISPPTVVQVIDGAIIGGPPTQMALPVGMDVFDHSIVQVRGGFIRGREQSIFLHDDAQLQMSGGEIRGSAVELRDSSEALFYGGNYAFLAYGDSRVELHGGLDGGGRAFENARIVQYDGHPDDLFLYDNSTFLMLGGSVGIGLQTFGNSRTLVNGGIINNLALLNDESVVTIRGGTQWGEFLINDEALLHVYGFGLEFVFEDDEHRVQGTLADGSVANFEYRLADQDQIILHEVPEPTTWGMLAIGVAGIAAASWNRTRAAKLRR
jgi:hypothetical protein